MVILHLQEKPSIFPPNQSMLRGRGGKEFALWRAELFPEVSQARGQRSSPTRTHRSYNQTKLMAQAGGRPACRPSALAFPASLGKIMLLGKRVGVWATTLGLVL